MPRLKPNHRALFVLKSIEQPTHFFEKALWCYNRSMKIDETVERAIELYVSQARSCIQGWLLATTDDKEISRRTRIDIESIEAYRHLFFDVSVFRDHFDLVDWARNEMKLSDSTPESNQYIRWAIMYGVESVAYMSGLPVNLDPHTVQTQAMINGHFMALMGREAGIGSPTAKEALKHQHVALSQAAIIAKKSPGLENIAIKLKHREMTNSIEFVDNTVEVLH